MSAGVLQALFLQRYDDVFILSNLGRFSQSLWLIQVHPSLENQAPEITNTSLAYEKDADENGQPRILGLCLPAIVEHSQTLFEFFYPFNLRIDQIKAVIKHGVNYIERVVTYLLPTRSGLIPSFLKALPVILQRL